MNAFYVRAEHDSLTAAIQKAFPAATLETGNGFTSAVLATDDFRPPREVLAKFSADWGTDVIWLAFQSVVDAFEFHHWENGVPARSLVYGCYQEERTWEEATGHAEPWEKDAFFEDRSLEFGLEHAENEQQKAELQRIWRMQEINPGRAEPGVSSKSAAWIVAKYYGLPGWGSPAQRVAGPQCVQSTPPPLPVAGKLFEVRARLVPRYLWTTASIDVFLEEQCVLMTGGQIKLTGSYASAFRDNSRDHVAELKWGKVSSHQFPYELWIDGIKVMKGRVAVENWRLGYIPATIIFLVMFGIAFAGMFHLISQTSR